MSIVLVSNASSASRSALTARLGQEPPAKYVAGGDEAPIVPEALAPSCSESSPAPTREPKRDGGRASCHEALSRTATCNAD
eukprot:3459658-Pleurochrysis_carterae.AAC.3